MKRGTPAKGKSRSKSGADQGEESNAPPKTPDMAKIKDILLRNSKPLTPIFTPRKVEDRTPRKRIQQLDTPVHVKSTPLPIPKPKISVATSTPVVCEFTHMSPNVPRIDVATSPFAAERQMTPISPSRIRQNQESSSPCKSAMLVMVLVVLLTTGMYALIVSGKL